MKEATIEKLMNPGVIAIVRAKSAASLVDIAEALFAGGIRAIETTLTTPGAVESVRQVPSELHSRMAVGVGTVLNGEAALAAIDAGARFLVSPVLRFDVIEACRSRSVPIVCGAFSPTEAYTAHEAGADFIKIFPADGLGPGYVKALLAPLPMLRIIPTGGVSADTCAAFVKAGCVAVAA